MRSNSRWRRFLLVAVVTSMVVLSGVNVFADTDTPTPSISSILAQIDSGDLNSLTQQHLPAAIAAMPRDDAVKTITDDPDLAIELANNKPEPQSTEPLESALAEIAELAKQAPDTAARIFSQFSPEDASGLTLIYPSTIGNLLGPAIMDRVAANRIRVAAVIAASTNWPQPDRPWTMTPRGPRAELLSIFESNRNLVYFDPRQNAGEGSWIELVGDIETTHNIAVLVPGGSAFITSDNFGRYFNRATSFVDGSSEDELAMLIWAAAPFPSGWIEEASPVWAQRAAPSLAAFTRDLRRQVGDDVRISLAGHSYGGAIVGESEKYIVDADVVLHVASAGSGYGIWTVERYTEPCRRRYVMLAPGDPISYVQNVPGGFGLGHGISPAELAGAHLLETGKLPNDPYALDDVGRTLGSQGITGKQIGGVHAHSEIFIPYSTAWNNLWKVFTGQHPTLLASQPPPLAQCK